MVSPRGRRRLVDLEFERDLENLLAEIHESGSSLMSGIVHPLVPPEMAPPEFLSAVRDFLLEHPFESNVFGMTRFPSAEPDELDPVSDALDLTRDALAMHGLEFHIASGRAIVDDLWMNVCAHMWASRYGIAVFEDRKGRGVNHNMTIEVGAMLMTGRRCALLKDESIPAMPTDLVGRIYKSLDLADADHVRATVHDWVREDLGFPSCGECLR